MIGDDSRDDLFVLAADLDIENVIRSLLTRPQSLGIRPLNFEVERHPDRDSGCRTRAVQQLRPFRKTHRHALVVFDRHGCGSSGDRMEIQSEVECRLESDGWGGRSKAIVIDPEIEAWVWSDSPHVPEILGWSTGYTQLRNWLVTRKLWPKASPKPTEPKQAMKEAMKKARSQQSSRVFSELAGKVSLHGCKDPAFKELAETIQRWFPTG